MTTEAKTASVGHTGLAPVKEILANGVSVIVKETKTTPAVTIHASILAGTVYDPPTLSGMAHFVSKVLDRGTATRSADAIAEELDSRGVSLAISVNRHALSVVTTCLVEDFAAILGLIGEIVMRPTFPAPQVDVKRGEILTLIRQDDDSPATVAANGLMALLYGDEHPYGRQPRGTVDSVGRIDAAMLQGFHRDCFVPSALSLVIVGDVTPSQAASVAASVFAPWKPAPAPAIELRSPSPASSRRTRVVSMMNKSQADIAYGFTTIVRSDPTYPAFYLMNNILGQYALGGRLGDSIRERQGMAYYAMSALDANVIAGPLLVRVGVNPANVERAVASVDAELRALMTDGPTEKEMRESTQYLIGSLPRTLETNMQIAAFLQTEEFFGLGLDYDIRIPALLRAVTPQQVVAAARTLDPSRASVVVAGPYDGELS
jgi:zinc protease